MLLVLWDEIGLRKIAANDVTQEEVEEIAATAVRWVFSRSSGRPMLVGTTSAGRRLCVPFEFINETTINPVTAYEPEEVA